MSQRLSHACLSKNLYVVTLRTAHVWSYGVFVGILWIHLVRLELMHAYRRDL